jgi:hypothetical protein
MRRATKVRNIAGENDLLFIMLDPKEIREAARRVDGFFGTWQNGMQACPAKRFGVLRTQGGFF